MGSGPLKGAAPGQVSRPLVCLRDAVKIYYMVTRDCTPARYMSRVLTVRDGVLVGEERPAAGGQP